MFFASPYEHTPSGLYSAGHVTLLLLTLLCVGGALYASRRMRVPDVRRTVCVLTLLLWLLEIGKILFVLLCTGSRNPNDFVPLYYCSLSLYAGALSCCKCARLRYAGDCFIATAGLVGGAVFLFFPTSTLPYYPAWHFLSLHSFFLHGCMVYLGLLLLMRGIYRPVWRDVRYPASLISVMCVLALIFNTVYDRVTGMAVANLMFISKDTPGTPLALVYRIAGPCFTAVMWLSQAVCPFLLVCGGYMLFVKIKRSRTK